MFKVNNKDTSERRQWHPNPNSQCLHGFFRETAFILACNLLNVNNFRDCLNVLAESKCHFFKKYFLTKKSEKEINNYDTVILKF